MSLICSSASMEMGYTIDDDGVHLICPCGFDENLGFFPTPLSAMLRACEHTGEDPMLLFTERKEES